MIMVANSTSIPTLGLKASPSFVPYQHINAPFGTRSVATTATGDNCSGFIPPLLAAAAGSTPADFLVYTEPLSLPLDSITSVAPVQTDSEPKQATSREFHLLAPKRSRSLDHAET